MVHGEIEHGRRPEPDAGRVDAGGGQPLDPAPPRGRESSAGRHGRPPRCSARPAPARCRRRGRAPAHPPPTGSRRQCRARRIPGGNSGESHAPSCRSALADAAIGEARRRHFGGLVHIAQVEKHGRGHGSAEALHVHRAELVPFRHQHGAVGASGGVIDIAAPGDIPAAADGRSPSPAGRRRAPSPRPPAAPAPAPGSAPRACRPYWA